MRKTTALSVALVACAATAWSVPVQKWVETTRSDFEAGDAKGTAILSLGQVVLAPELKPLLEKPVAHVLALAADPRGTLYAGVGFEPKLLRLRDGKAETFFTSPEKTDIEILAVALGPDGAIYASAAPSGTLFRIAPDGKAAPLYKGTDPYIWAIAVAPDGTLYAGTGPTGKLLKITPKGEATTVLAANANHVLCLLLAADGTLYAGTDKEGLLYEVSPKGAVRVAYDAEQSDIRAMALDDQGRLYFATAATSPAKASTASAGASTRTVTITPGQATAGAASDQPTPATKPAAPGAKINATNALYRLARNGEVVKIDSLSGVALYSLAWFDGHLYAGTGNNGDLYRLDGTDLIKLAHLDDSQITAMAAAQGSLCLATANAGQVYPVTSPHGAEGTLVSDVYDTDSLAHWGTIGWQERTPDGTSITLATRTGNTQVPDATWSPWSKAYDQAEGQNVTSPSARFIQYRATLKGPKGKATPLLDEVVIAYVETNLPPAFAKVEITKPPEPRRPTIPQQPGTPPTPPKPQLTKPLNTKKQPASSQRGPFEDSVRLLWQAKDPNDDGMVFGVFFRGEDETTWKKLAEGIDALYYDWDTHAVPDGLYRIRLIASDQPTNPPGQAQTATYTTESFMIDNTPPTVANLVARVEKDRTVTVSADCKDTASGLASGEYSIDAGDWVDIVPVDGIFDSNAETLQFKTPAVGPGEHTLVVRVKDDAENSGAAKAVFNVK